MPRKSPSRPARPPRARPGKRTPGSALLRVCLVSYAALLTIWTAVSVAGPDDWWLSAALMYAPAAALLLPMFLLVPWALVSERRQLLTLLALGLWIVWPLMGLAVHPLTAASPAGGRHLRVMTYNVKWGRRHVPEILAEIERWNPDLVLMQDSGPLFTRGDMGGLRGSWRMHSGAEYAIVSRLRYSDPLVIHLDDTQPTGYCTSWRVEGRPSFQAVNVHLQSPRRGLMALAYRGEAGSTKMAQNADVRLVEGAALMRYVSGLKGPAIICGDLNSPMQSRVCQMLGRAGFRDAFDEAGNGYGYTYGHDTAVRLSYVRIDHILVSQEWRVLACHTGGKLGSDHRPVIADLWLPSSGQ